jgi:lysozyme
MNLALLAQELEIDEGKKAKPYRCTAGKLSIGIGRNLDDRGVSADEIALKNDMDSVFSDLDKNTPWWRQMTDARQRVLANMCFNLGIVRLLGFKNTLKDMRDGHYDLAADGMLNSLWAKQVGIRAQRLAKMMREG